MKTIFAVALSLSVCAASVSGHAAVVGPQSAGGSFSRTVSRSFNSTATRTFNSSTSGSFGPLNSMTPFNSFNAVNPFNSARSFSTFNPFSTVGVTNPSLSPTNGTFAVSLGRTINGIPTVNVVGTPGGSFNSSINATFNPLTIGPVNGRFNTPMSGFLNNSAAPFGGSVVPFDSNPFSNGLMSPGSFAQPVSFGAGGGYGGGSSDYEANGGPPETPASTILKGEAQLIAAQGAYNQATAAAANTQAEAESKSLSNQANWVKAYYDWREAGRIGRERERGPRPTAEELARRAQAGAPRLLTTNQIDPISGELHWPSFLQDPRFVGERAAISRIAENWVRYGELDYRDQEQMREAIGMMLGGLKSHINVLPPQEYVACRSFLDSLAFATTHALM